MKKLIVLVVLIVLIPAEYLHADITIHEPNYVCVRLPYEIDAQTPRLEAIRNPDYGFGVIAASINNGILQILRITESSVDHLRSMSGFAPDSAVGDIRFDTTGLFNENLFVLVWTDTAIPGEWRNSRTTRILKVPANLNEEIVDVVEGGIGEDNDRLMFVIDFTTDVAGYAAGAYLLDFSHTDGTSFYHMDLNYNCNKIGQDFLPGPPYVTVQRNDLDIWGMEFDPTDLYGSYLTMADGEEPSHNYSTIWQLHPDLTTWSVLSTPALLSD